MKHRSKHAFTLTELLVVVPVAALLTTMLFAVSNDATQQLQAAACLNNMRQWSLGFMLYANDYRDYFPYDGSGPAGACDSINADAWFNVVAPYIGQKRLCDLYLAGQTNINFYPTPHNPSVWVCPSATNKNPTVNMHNPVFYYGLSTCWHMEGSTRVGFRRNRATIPANTILFCEEPEDNFGETNGKYDFVTRHFGGSNFVFDDGHAGWIHFTNFCRAGNPGCPPPLGNIGWDNSGPQHGDWQPGIPYHWWPFLNANTSPE